MPPRRFAIFLLLCISLASQATAQPAASTLRWEVEAPPSLTPVAERLRRLEPERLAGAMRLVGLADAGPPVRVIVAPEGSEPARSVPPWVSGYALSEQGIVVLLPARTPTYPDSSLEDLFRHEIAHVLVARAARGGEVPRWFHEGVAMVAGLTWGLDDVSRASLAVMVQGEVPLSALDSSFAGAHGEVQRAYAIAGTFVRDLLERHGQGVAGEILAGVGRGLPFDEAFARATGETLAAAEAGFWARQSFWYRWVPFLTSSVALWIGITLLALWAIRRRRRRDAALRELWEQEESRLAETSLDEPVN